MHRLYLDTCVINDAFVVTQREFGGTVPPRALKRPLVRWLKEYLALYYLLDLSDQWELEFVTGESARREISKWRPKSPAEEEKLAFLEDMFAMLQANLPPEGAAPARLRPDASTWLKNQRILDRLDAEHVAEAVRFDCNLFVTTDFETILDRLDNRRLQVGGSGIDCLSPLEFLEKTFVDMPMLVRTLYGSWEDYDQFVADAQSELESLVHRST